MGRKKIDIKHIEDKQQRNVNINSKQRSHSIKERSVY